MKEEVDRSRRSMLWIAPLGGVALRMPAVLLGQKKQGAEEGDKEVTPTEDLMREHGLLKRILLIYDEVDARIAQQKEFPPDAVTNSAKIIRSFIEQYHEKLEEDYLFPRFRKHNLLVDLVNVLQQQHEAGRRVTEQILALSGSGLKSSGDKQKLATALHQFARMYAQHEAREDTVFPAFHKIVSRNEYDALGEDLGRRHHHLYGKEGFEGMMPRVEQTVKQ